MMNNESTWTQEGEHHTLGSVGCGGLGRDSRGGGGWGGITLGEMPDVGDGGMEAANHVAIYVPMQQFCMPCTCTPEPEWRSLKHLETTDAGEDVEK